MMIQMITIHFKTLDLENVKDQHPYELSIGQKRRLSVATAQVLKLISSFR